MSIFRKLFQKQESMQPPGEDPWMRKVNDKANLLHLEEAVPDQEAVHLALCRMFSEIIERDGEHSPDYQQLLAVLKRTDHMNEVITYLLWKDKKLFFEEPTKSEFENRYRVRPRLALDRAPLTLVNTTFDFAREGLPPFYEEMSKKYAPHFRFSHAGHAAMEMICASLAYDFEIIRRNEPKEIAEIVMAGALDAMTPFQKSMSESKGEHIPAVIEKYRAGLSQLYAENPDRRTIAPFLVTLLSRWLGTESKHFLHEMEPGRYMMDLKVDMDMSIFFFSTSGVWNKFRKHYALEVSQLVEAANAGPRWPIS